MGYTMRSFVGLRNLIDVYEHDKRKGKPWNFYVHLALNLSKAVFNFHEIKQILGDLNPTNIMINMKNGRVILVDTDSFHIKDKTNSMSNFDPINNIKNGICAYFKESSRGAGVPVIAFSIGGIYGVVKTLGIF